MAHSDTSVLCFAGFELEPDERRLTRGGRPVDLTPKTFDLLLLMARNAGHVLSKDDLMTSLWPGRIVTEANLTKQVWLLRKALGEDGPAEGCIQTVSKVGYRFVAPIDVAPAPVASGSAGEAARRTVSTPPWRGRRLAGLAGAVLAGAAAFALPWLRPVISRLVAPPPTSAVAILGFRDLGRATGAGWIGPALADTLGTEVGLGGQYRLVPAELVEPARTAAPPPRPGGYAEGTLHRLSSRLAADWLVGGGYLVSGAGADARVRVDIVLQNARDGRVVDLTREQPLAELPSLVSWAGAQLRADMHAPLPAGGANLAEGLRAPTGEVMRHMSEGETALARRDPASAKDSFLAALGEAPAYAPAYAGLSRAWSDMGYQAKAAAAAEQAVANAGALPAPIRLSIAAQRDVARYDWPSAAAALRRLVDISPKDVDARLRLIGVLISGDRPDQAESVYKALRALPGAGGTDPRIELAGADAAAANDRTEERIAHALQAWREARTAGAGGLAADAELQLGTAMIPRDRAAAERWLEAAIRDEARLGNPRGEARARQNLGTLLSEDRPAQARAAYEAALREFQLIGDPAGEAAARADLAIMLWSSGDRDAAEAAVRQVLELRRRTGDLAGQAWALTALAIEEGDDSASDTVVGLFRRAIAADAAAHKRSHLAFTLFSLSDILRLRGELGEAERACEQARALYAASPDPAIRSSADFECALIALDQGAVEGALARLASARAEAARLGDTMALGNADQLAGQIAAGQGHAARAAAYLARAAREFAAADLATGEANAEALLAVAEQHLGHRQARDAAAARARLLRSRANARQEVLDADIALAQLRGETGDRVAALNALQALTNDALHRQWPAWALAARLAAAQVLVGGPDPRAAAVAARALAADARRAGFGWVAQRVDRLRPTAPAKRA